MSEPLVLKKKPRIAFHLQDKGFQVLDEETEKNNGFYAYADIKSIELNSLWFPKMGKYLRVITWVLNGVPYFPEAYKKANLKIYCSNAMIGIWLTSGYMANKAQELAALLEEKSKHSEVE